MERCIAVLMNGCTLQRARHGHEMPEWFAALLQALLDGRCVACGLTMLNHAVLAMPGSMPCTVSWHVYEILCGMSFVTT